LRLASGDGDRPAASGSLLEEVLAEGPGFLGTVESDDAVLAGKIRAEVDNGLKEANRLMAESPESAENELKALLEQVERAPALNAEVRAQLRQQIETAIRLAGQEDQWPMRPPKTLPRPGLQRLTDQLNADRQSPRSWIVSTP
jgi:hypothetical protein